MATLTTKTTMKLTTKKGRNNTMKERIFKTNKDNLIRNFVTLLAVALSVLFISGYYTTVVKADDVAEKELVQYEEDGWVIFKYFDEDGIPQFDITYKSKTVEDFEAEHSFIEYKIINKNHYYINDAPWKSFNNSNIKREIKQNSQTPILVQFRLLESIYQGDNDDFDPMRDDEYEYFESAKSEIFPLYFLDEDTVYISSTNIGYFETYNLSSNPNKFTVNIKFNEPLKQDGDVEINVDSIHDNAVNYSKEKPSSNLSFENYNKTYVVNGKTYTMEYSIVSFDVNLLPSYFNAFQDITIEYKFSFNNLSGIYSNKSTDIFQLFALTPPEKSTTAEESTTIKESTVPITTTSVVSTPLKVKVKKIKLKASAKKVKVGKKVKITATITPTNATNKKLTWKSSNTKYATVSSKGVVKAKKAGKGKTVTITVKAKDGSGKKASIKIKIKK